MFERLLKKSSILIEKSRSILIIPDQSLSNDTIGSTFGLALFLESLEKKVDTLILPDLSEKIPFSDNESLKKPSFLISEIFDPRAFVIKINTNKKPASQLRYEMDGDFLKIIIDSEKENFDSKDVSFEYTPFGYDLIITVGLNNIANLGSTYSDNKDFFEQTPTININNRSAGINLNKETHLNLINQSCSSKSEIIHSLLKTIRPDSTDENVVNWLALSAAYASSTNSKTAADLFARGTQKETVEKPSQTKENNSCFNLAAKLFSLKSFTKIKNNIFVKIPDNFFGEEVTKITILNLAKELSLNFLKTENIFLFLEKNNEFIVAAYIKNGGSMEETKGKIGGNIYENCIFSKIKASNIDEAQQKIITLLNISW